MAIKESALTLITSIAQGDWIRAVTSAGASRRVTVANLAKAIVESYTGSSLAGSNQSVKAAIDSLNSKNSQSIATTYVTELTCYKRGNVGFLKIRDPKNLPSGTSIGVGTLPEGYRPPVEIQHYIPLRNASSGIALVMSTNGSIAIHNYSSNTGTLNIGETFCYPLA